MRIIYNEQKGRSGVANQDLSQGDILMISKPYAIVPTVRARKKVCENCTRISTEQTRSKEEIACRQGCLHVFYCSKQCEQLNWEKFHQFECPFLDKEYVLQSYYSPYEDVIDHARVVMRMLTQRLHEISEEPKDTSLEDVFVLASHFDKLPSDMKDEYLSVAKTLTEYILTRLIPHLAKDGHEFIGFIRSFLPHFKDLERIEIISPDLWLSAMTRLCLLTEDATNIEALKHLLIKVCILISAQLTNSYNLHTFLLNDDSQPSQVYAVGFYISAALFNHSCSPNIDRFAVQERGARFDTTDLVFFAAYPVKKDDELCFNYLGREYNLYMQDKVDVGEIITSRTMRKQELNHYFLFNCECSRCDSESKGELDRPLLVFIKQRKCTRSNCHGWLIPSLDEHMRCEACGTSR